MFSLLRINVEEIFKRKSFDLNQFNKNFMSKDIEREGLRIEEWKLFLNYWEKKILSERKNIREWLNGFIKREREKISFTL